MRGREFQAVKAKMKAAEIGRSHRTKFFQTCFIRSRNKSISLKTTNNITGGLIVIQTHSNLFESKNKIQKKHTKQIHNKFSHLQ